LVGTPRGAAHDDTGARAPGGSWRRPHAHIIEQWGVGACCGRRSRKIIIYVLLFAYSWALLPSLIAGCERGAVGRSACREGDRVHGGESTTEQGVMKLMVCDVLAAGT